MVGLKHDPGSAMHYIEVEQWRVILESEDVQIIIEQYFDNHYKPKITKFSFNLLSLENVQGKIMYWK